MSFIIIIRIIAVKYKLALPKFDSGNETIDWYANRRNRIYK
jgi:uncharacterized membrane protein YeiH